MQLEFKIEQKSRLIHPDTDLQEVAEVVACYYHCSVSELTAVSQSKSKNEKRQAAILLCQEIAGAKLSTIAKYFNLTAIGSVCSATHQIRQERRNDQVFDRKIVDIIQTYLKMRPDPQRFMSVIEWESQNKLLNLGDLMCRDSDQNKK